MDPPASGFVNVTATTYNSMATFTCQTGYGLVGMATIICLDTGAWSGAVPTCVLNCPTLEAPQHGQITLTPDSIGRTVATFTCDLGYDLVGKSRRSCEDGAWTKSSPVCIAKGQLILQPIHEKPNNLGF